MSTKRARYDGPYEEVFVELNSADVYDTRAVVVKRGGLLPLEDESGEPIPASLRDELLDREDWSEVKQADHKAKED